MVYFFVLGSMCSPLTCFALAASFNAPPTQTDLLSLPAEVYYNSAAIGLGAFTAAQAALKGFRDEAHRDHPKAFIVTGNVLPYTQKAAPSYFTLGVQKALETRLIATASENYEPEGIRFYFASLLTKEGASPGYEIFRKSGKIHSEVYWDLINSKKQGHWDQR